MDEDDFINAVPVSLSLRIDWRQQTFYLPRDRVYVFFGLVHETLGRSFSTRLTSHNYCQQKSHLFLALSFRSGPSLSRSVALIRTNGARSEEHSLTQGNKRADSLTPLGCRELTASLLHHIFPPTKHRLKRKQARVD